MRERQNKVTEKAKMENDRKVRREGRPRAERIPVENTHTAPRKKSGESESVGLMIDSHLAICLRIRLQMPQAGFTHMAAFESKCFVARTSTQCANFFHSAASFSKN